MSLPSSSRRSSADPGPGDAPSRLLVPLCGFLPGLLAGTQVTGLLFFLNPELSYDLPSFLRGVGLFGGLLGLLSFTVTLPWTWRNPRRACRILPWAITLVLASAAILHGVHAARNSFFVPPGINVRLIKAAAWLAAGALLGFYTALLHTLHSRRYGRRSRIGILVVALASVFVMIERREAFKPLLLPTPLPSTVEVAPSPRLLVVGIEGATLDAILPLAEQGHLPFFARLLQEGAYARLESLAPNRPPALWTTVATGKLPYRHGISTARVEQALFLRPVGQVLRLTPEGIGFRYWAAPGLRPLETGSDLRRSLALWEILPRLGVQTGVVGWPASHPAPEAVDFAFSARYFSGGQSGTRSGATARPAELAEKALLFHIEAGDLPAELTQEFGDEVPFDLLETLAEDRWRETLTGYLVEQRSEVRALFVLLPGLAKAAEDYMGGFAAVHLRGAPSSEQQAAERALTAYYRHLDRYLAQSWDHLSGGPRVLAVVSAWGVEEPTGWRHFWRLVTRRPLTGSTLGAPAGLLFLAGDGIRQNHLGEGVSLADVMPTLLYAMGLPVARDLDGRVLTSAFDSTFLAGTPLTYVPSHETLATREPPAGEGG